MHVDAVAADLAEEVARVGVVATALSSLPPASSESSPHAERASAMVTSVRRQERNVTVR
jgi:hypothetical protein